MKIFPLDESQPLKEELATEADKSKIKRFSIYFESLKYKSVWLRALKKIRCVLVLKDMIKAKKFLRKRVSLLSNDQGYCGLASQMISITDDDLKWYILHPESILKNIWNFYMGVLLIYTAFVMPYTMAFIDTKLFDGWFYMNMTVDMSFLLDIIVNLFSAYYEKRMNLVKSHRKIIKKYASTWMVFDILSCIPFEFIEIFQPSLNTSNLRVFLKFLRLPKISRIFKFLKIFSSSSNYQRNLVAEKIQELFSLKQSSIRLATSCLYILLSLHIMSCLWYLSAKIEGLGPSTWVTREGLLDSDSSSLYITCFYWAATSFTTVGYGDISAANHTERIFSIIWMLFSVYFFSYIIGSLSSNFETANMKDNILSNKLHLVDELAKNSDIGHGLLRKLKQALKYSHKQNFLDISEKEKILKELPLQLRFEIAMAMFGKAVSKIKFFKEKDKVIISEVVPHLQPLYASSDTFIYEKGEHSEGIYFILSGFAAYTFKNGSMFVKGISAGEYFGDIEATMRITRKYCVKAIKSLDILLMKNDVIQTLHDNYYDEWVKIRNEAACKNIEMIRKISLIKTKYFSNIQNKRKYRISVEGIIQKKTKKFEEETSKATNSNLTMESVINTVNNINSRLYQMKKTLQSQKKRRSLRGGTRFSQHTPQISSSSYLELPEIQ